MKLRIKPIARPQLPTPGQIATGDRPPQVEPDPLPSGPVDPQPVTLLPGLLDPTGVLYVPNPMAALWARYGSIQAYNQRLSLPEYTDKAPDMCEIVNIEPITLKVVL